MTTISEPVVLRPGANDGGELRELTRLEKAVGPEWARLLRGIVTNPLSVAGIVITLLFALMAIFAPLLAPPPNENWPRKQIPRDGFKAEPQPPMSGWTGYARQLRGDILATKERDYVLAARASGAKDSHLMIKHVIPNAMFPTLVRISLNMGAVVLSFAALSFLGIGLPEGYADWGQVVSFARSFILTLDTYWYIIIFPGLALLFYGLGWNLIGDALRDILDPKLRGKKA